MRNRGDLRPQSENGARFDLWDKSGPRIQLVRLAPEAVAGPLPAVFREEASGLLRVIDRELVIRFRSGLSGRVRRSLLKAYGLVVCRRNAFIPDQVIVAHPAGRVSGEDLIEISNELTQLEEVTLVTPSFVSEYWREVPPSVLSAEWHLHNAGLGGATKGEDLGIREAWKVTTGRREITVAVLDDGVDVDHPNLAANLWKNPVSSARDAIGRDFSLPDDHPDHFNPRPKRFRFPFDQVKGSDIHGTPCAGLVAAYGLRQGSVGVAPGCRVLPVKIFHGDSLAADERVADAIRYAAIHADLLNCSWSGGTSLDVEQALEDAGRLGRRGRGSVVFCAAGNESVKRVAFPARDPHAIAVGASTDQARRAAYSNTGPEIAFVAPSSGGVRAIFTTDVSLPRRGFNPDGLHTDRFGGTSAAAPLAAGVAALVLSVNPTLSREDLKSLLAATADKIGDGYDARGRCEELGFGRINAGKAVLKALRLAR
jgi:subtilisin family serine protease